MRYILCIYKLLVYASAYITCCLLMNRIDRRTKVYGLQNVCTDTVLPIWAYSKM